MVSSEKPLTEDQVSVFLDQVINKNLVFFDKKVHDRMTECRYLAPLATFQTGAKPEPVKTIPLLEQGKAALEEINKGRK